MFNVYLNNSNERVIAKFASNEQAEAYCKRKFAEGVACYTKGFREGKVRNEWCDIDYR